MITLKLSLLVAINIHQQKSKNVGIPKLPKSARKTPKANKPNLETKTETETENIGIFLPDENYENISIIHVQNPQYFLHIEYELIPNSFIFSIDVVCWEKIAKIYINNQTKCIKTLIKDGLIWIPICIRHSISELPTPSIEPLMEHNIHVQLKMGLKNLGPTARSDDCKSFYILTDNIENDNFPEAFSDTDSVDIILDNTESAAKIVQDILSEVIYNLPAAFEISSKISNPIPVHLYNIKKIIANAEDHSIRYQESVLGVSQLEAKHKKNTEVLFPAHFFLTNPTMAVFKWKENIEYISKAFVLMSSQHLLTPAQKKELGPFIVKLPKISNLPAKILKLNGFSEIFLKCIIPEIDTFETSSKPISENVRFDKSRLIFTQDIPKLKLLSLLQVKCIIVEVHGVKQIFTQNDDVLLSLEENKKSKKKTPPKKKQSKLLKPKPIKIIYETITLAVAKFDVNSLSRKVSSFKEKGSCRSIRSCTALKIRKLKDCIEDVITPGEVNTITNPPPRMISPLTDEILMNEQTMVTLEAKLMTPLYPSYFTDIGNTYKRFLLIIVNAEFASKFVKDILVYNNDLLSISMNRPGPMYRQQQYIFDDSERALLTGFVLDDVENVILYIEGICAKFILKLIHQFSSLDYSMGRVFYNSDHAFEKRVYSSLLSFSGIVPMTLKIPIRDILEKPQVYLEGTVPLPCWKALQKLQLIYHSNSFHSILADELLPTEIEMFSLWLEFGLSVRYAVLPKPNV